MRNWVYERPTEKDVRGGGREKERGGVQVGGQPGALSIPDQLRWAQQSYAAGERQGIGPTPQKYF